MAGSSGEGQSEDGKSARDTELSVQGACCRTSNLSSRVGGPLVFYHNKVRRREDLFVQNPGTGFREADGC